MPNALVTQACFDAALARVLKDFVRPERLTANPLLAMRLVSAELRPGSDPLLGVQVLRRLIQQQVEALGEIPKTRHYQAVLEATYLHPAANQAAAARSLGMPYGSYRRYLSDARKLLATRLWLAEIESAEQKLMRNLGRLSA